MESCYIANTLLQSEVLRSPMRHYRSPERDRSFAVQAAAYNYSRGHQRRDRSITRITFSVLLSRDGLFSSRRSRDYPRN